MANRTLNKQTQQQQQQTTTNNNNKKKKNNNNNSSSSSSSTQTKKERKGEGWNFENLKFNKKSFFFCSSALLFAACLVFLFAYLPFR